MSEDLLGRAVREGIPVAEGDIEKMLSELWKSEGSENASMRAALWNVVVHTASVESRERAIETVGKVALAIPQRTVVVLADPAGGDELSSYVRANCHLIGQQERVCSEVVSIAAGGSRVGRIPPLVSALLVPDMPVAVWWVGDLPHENEKYVDALLESADRLITDSSAFDDPADVELVTRLSSRTRTAPADLAWLQLEPWRVAAAALFDCAEMRARLKSLERLRVVATAPDPKRLGAWMQPLLFAAWFLVKAGVAIDEEGRAGGVECVVEVDNGAASGLTRIELRADGADAVITNDGERCLSSVSGVEKAESMRGVTRSAARTIDQLIVRELGKPYSDPLLLEIMSPALRLARRFVK